MPVSRFFSAFTVVTLLGAVSGQPNVQLLSTHRVYWNTILSDFAMISVSADTAAMAAVDGDRDRADRALAYGRKFADILSDTLRSMPPDWRERIGPQLSQAALALTAGGNALRLYLAHRKTGDLKSAQHDQAQAALALVAATSEAKASYAAMGGKSNDLESLAHATQTANAALSSAMGDTDTDDQ